MKVSYLNRSAVFKQKLFCITHSERPFHKDRGNLNFLEQRYSNSKRLPPPVPFGELTPSSEHSPYLGAVSIWEFEGGDFRKPKLIAHLVPTYYKPQFVIWYKERFWILGVEVLEVFDSSFSRLAVVRDPWLSGAHTLIPDRKGRLLISCAASDSVIFINEENYEVVKTIRMPESLYGYNYSLSREDSVVDHYIINDYQLTHVNCACPWRNGFLVSTLIQGAIGWFDEFENYHEFLRGFVGCHGVRVDIMNNLIYFCDTCTGTLVFLTDSFKIDHRIGSDSIWLHDAQQLDESIFAMSVADRNQIEIMDTSSSDILNIIKGHDFGQAPFFIYYGE